MIKKDEIKRFIDKDKISKRKQAARVGQRYYEADHDIKDYRTFYYDADGVLVEDKHRTNVKIAHPFFTELVDQATDYLLSGKHNIVRSDLPELKKELDKYFDDCFKQELGEVVSHIQIHGFAYLYRYKGGDMRSKFAFADGLGVIEIDGRFASDKKDYIIYYYGDVEIDNDFNEQPITRVQVWSKTATHYFVLRSDELEKDKDVKINPRPHIVYKKGAKLLGDIFGNIPFYRVDNNKKKSSDIHQIKALIDDYDLHACSLTNDIQDFNSAIYLVKGFQGEKLDELITNIKTKKVVGTPENGDLQVKTIAIPYEARKIKLEQDEKAIYKFGNGFNSEQVGGGNLTNVVVKSRYANLDLKCNRIERSVRRLMRNIIQIALGEINKKMSSGYTLNDVYMVFERNFISNDLDNAEIAQRQANTRKTNIDTLLNLTEILGEQKVLDLVGDELDIDTTMIQLDTMQTAKADLTAASGALLDITPAQAAEQAQVVTQRQLNGAQTKSLLEVMARYASGGLTLLQAANVLGVSIGATRDEAVAIIQGLE